MHRYLPLTAVLLAFWLGSETSAGRSKVTTFGKIVCEQIEIKGSNPRLEIKGKGLFSQTPSKVVLTASTVMISQKSGKDAVLLHTAALAFKSKGKVATDIGTGYISLCDDDQKSRVELNASGRPTVVIKNARGDVVASMPGSAGSK